MTGSARLFVALDLPSDVREALGGWGLQARREGGPMRLVDVEMLHVTMAFLGSRPVADVDAIGAAVRTCAAPVTGLSLGAPLWLPRRRPRALAVQVHDDGGALAAVQASLVAGLADALAWEPERRVFRPHVTVARMSAGSGPRTRALPPTPAACFDGVALTLYRSFLSPSGATYESLASASLPGGPAA